MSNNFQDTTLFTYDRLNAFVDQYTKKISSIMQSARDTSGGLYEYYHFEYSPKGIQMTDIKRIPQQILTVCTNWTSFIELNTPNSWKLNAGQQYLKIKQKDVEYSKTLNKIPGLAYTLITIPSIPTDYNSFKAVSNSSTYINAFNNASSVFSSGIASALNDYSSSFNDPTNTMLTKFAKSNVQGFACEWYGYFYPSNGIGTYTFTIGGIGSGAGYYYVWIGPKAVCEYTGFANNVDIYTNSPSFKIAISEQQYYPIRIQFFANNTSGINSSLINLNLSITQNNNIPIQNCLYTLKNPDGSTYYPLLQYCAFVSLSPANLQQGLFQYYYNDLTSNPSLYSDQGIYSIINNYKFNMQSGVFDNDTSNQKNFGTLPDKTNWTPVENFTSETPDPKPYAYSIYRIDVDLRMGKSFQINPVVNSDGTYTMSPMNPNLLTYSSNYDEFPNYYPSETTNNTQILSKFTKNLLETATDDSPIQCEINCNNNPNCGYYYTYTTENNHPKCVIDTDNSEPTFNQIPPTNPNNSTETYMKGSLFLRERQFIQPKCPGESIASNGKQYNPDYISFTTVKNTDQYGMSFPFAKYQLGPEINDVSGIGICGDTNNGLKQQNDMAKDILFKDAIYMNYGSSWKEGMQSTPTSTPTPNIKVTNVIKDTTDSIRAGLQNQQQYANMMNSININYQKLTNQSIPHYLATREILESNPNYDYNGNTLLYYNSEPVLTVQQQRVIDTDEGIAKQNSLYILGTLTAATLLVLALILGKE